ncbi:non-ribosomal peptide synthetase [Peribacillus simplex]|uniref:non-ribosomal peptide synthetase n=1 Tax=Peribacillus simplex TaxID=1478 RepID=UPI0021AA3C2C|nr:non-ribosomal peptide synthetase [Peribacillus simplex]
METIQPYRTSNNRIYPDHELCIHELVEKQVDKNPEQIAVTFEQQSLSYFQMNEQANRLARYLKEKGVVSETPVLVCLERSLEMVVALLGILKAGGAYVPIDPETPEDRLSYMIEDMNTPFLIAKRDKEHMFSTSADVLKEKVWIDESHLWSHHSSYNFGEGDPDQLMYIIYTSGSTGRPKGVMNTHRALNNRLQWMQEEFSLTQRDKVLQKTPFNFDVSVWEFFWPLISGAMIVLAKPGGHKDPEYLKEVITTEEITTIHFVPSMLGIFLESISQREHTSLRRVICSGEALTKNVELEFFKKLQPTELFNLYGPTEAAIDVSYWICTGSSEENSVPIGYPISNIQLYILNSDNEPVAIGETGELHIGGIGLARGYYGKQELTDKSFIIKEKHGRVYKTGDLCRYREDGVIEYIGRKDFQVQIRGFRIELGEIEVSIESQDNVKQCVVTPVQKGNHTYLAAYVTFYENKTCDEKLLKTALASRLPDYMVPAAIITLKSFPLSPNGKIDRKQLPDPFEGGKEIHRGARTALEQNIAQIWEKLLQWKGIGTNIPFLQAGGNSLFAARLVTRFREDLNLSIGFKEVFEHPTIEAQALLAQEVSRSLQIKDQPRSTLSRLPLSDAQKRLWFIQKLEGDSALYNLPHYVKIKGMLDVRALKESVNRVLRQHNIFKYRFKEEEGLPFLHLDHAVPDEMTYTDLSHLSQGEAEDRVFELMKQDAETAFDFMKGPFYRIQLYCLSDELNILSFNFHHIISDGWSDQVFKKSVFNHYASLVNGTDIPSAPSVQYEEYIGWQSGMQSSKWFEEQLCYWENRLPQHAPAVQLQAGIKKSSVLSQSGKELHFKLPSESINKLKVLCEEKGFTLYMALLAIYKIFLYRLSAEKEISVGTPVAGRKRKDFEELIGFFVNTVVIRDEVDPNASFIKFLGQVKGSALDAFSNDDVPFEKVVERIRPSRGMNENPLFQFMFSYQDLPKVTVEVEGLEISESNQIHTGTSKFDLTLTIEKQDDGFVGKWEYRSDCYTDEVVHSFTSIFNQLLQSGADFPEESVQKLSLLSADERNLMIQGLNETKVEFPAVCLHELFEQQVERTPEHIAAIFEKDCITYRELDKKSNQLARLLIAKGVKPDTPVGLRMDRSLNLIVAILGILKAGGAYLPIDKEAPELRVKSLLVDAEAPICLVDEEIGEKVAGTAEFILYDKESEELGTFDSSKPENGVRPEHLVSVYYTSGSTGNPKGVSSTHKGWVNRMCWMQNKHGLKEGDIALQKTTLTFDDAAVEFFWPLMVGGKIAFIPPGAHRDPVSILNYALKYNVTLLQFVPSMLEMILQEITPQQREKLSRLRVVVSSGEALKSNLVQSFYEKMPGSLYNTWGATEVSIDSTCFDCLPMDGTRKEIVSVGRPIDNNRIYVLDQLLTPVPFGVPGDFYIAGIGLARGYMNNPKKTEEAFIDDPFFPGEKMYRTGDRGYFNNEGNIMFLGREDNQVKVRGMRVELGEIESSILSFPAIKEAVVSPYKQHLVAYYTRESKAQVEPYDLKKKLSSHLPEYMVPAYYVRLDAFPLNSNGKVDRKNLKAPEEEHLIVNTVFSEPKNKTEEKMLSIWRDKLGIIQIGTQDNFFELGGHSLLGVQIVSQMNKDFKVNLPVKVLFENPTIADLSRQIEGKDRHTLLEEIEIAADRDQLFPLSDAQKRVWFLDQLTENTNYYMPFLLTFKSQLDVERLNKALIKLIDRHEILRTNFIEVDGIPYQKVNRSIPFDLELLNENLQEIIHRKMNNKFCLNQGPLLNGTVIRENSQDHLLLVLHHLICDGWSLNVLKKELFRFYENEDFDLNADPLQYADYSVWQQAEKEEINQQLSYWRERLSGDIPCLELPSDKQQEGTGNPENVTLNLALDSSIASAIKSFSKCHKTTPFAVFLSIFNVLLARLSKQKDIIIGTPVVNRNRHELEEAIGLYLNTLPLRTKLKMDGTFTDLIHQVNESVRDAFSNQDVPFERIVEEVQPERILNRNPLFDVMLNYRSFDHEKLSRLDGIEVEETEVEEIASKFFMTLYIEEVTEGYHCRISYQNTRFSQERMESFLHQFKHLTQLFMGDPDQRLLNASLITEDSQKVLPNPKSPLEEKLFPTVMEEINRWVLLQPDKTAIEAGHAHYTYQQLADYSKRLSRRLIVEGILPGDVVAVHGTRSFEMVGSILAVLQAGATFLNVDDQVPDNRLEYMLRTSYAKGLLYCSPPTESTFEEIAKRLNVKVMDSETLLQQPGITNEVEVKATVNENAYIFFTSGTTGEPKGVLGTHNSLSHFLTWQRQRFNVTPADRCAQLTHVTFDVYLRDIFLPLTSGAVLCVPNDKEADLDVLQWLGAKEITLLHAVPSLTKLWIERSKTIKENNLRHIFFAGEPLSSQLVSKWKTFTTAEIHNFYGQTESTLAKCCFSLNEPFPDVVLPIGKPIEGAQLLLLNEGGELCGVGEQGEIYIRTPYMTKGYLGLGLGTFTVNPFTNNQQDKVYKTGDLGRYRPNGTIEICGRKDEQIKIRGVRIEKNEIISAILKQPYVKECAVISMERDGELQLAAFVVTEDGRLDSGLMRLKLRNDLPLAMIPSRFISVKEFPVTSNGKINREKLLKLDRDLTNRSSSETDFEGELENGLHKIWTELLSSESFGPDDNFFELGGHSLMIVRMAAMVKDRWKKNLTLMDVFRYPTVRGIAAHLSSLEGERKKAPIKRIDRSKHVRSTSNR